MKMTDKKYQIYKENALTVFEGNYDNWVMNGKREDGSLINALYGMEQMMGIMGINKPEIDSVKDKINQKYNK